MHYQHNNLLDVSAFEMPIKSIKDPVLLLKDINGIEKQTKMDKQVVVYRPDTMEILGRSRSNQYKIVNLLLACKLLQKQLFYFQLRQYLH